MALPASLTSSGRQARPPPQAAPSFWSRFFCRDAELISPDSLPQKPNDGPCFAQSSSQEKKLEENGMSALSSSAQRHSQKGSPPTDSSDEDSDKSPQPLPHSRNSLVLSPTRSSLSMSVSGSTRHTPAAQKAMTRDVLYESIRAVRTARRACRRGEGGGGGSFSPQKVHLAVKSDNRVLTVPAALPPVPAFDDSTERDTSASAPPPFHNQASVTSSTALATPPQPSPAAHRLSSSTASKQRRFHIKDTRFFTSAHQTGAAAHCEVALPFIVDSDPDDARRLAQALTEKRLQQHQQKLAQDRRQREEANALRELEREQRLAARQTEISGDVDAFCAAPTVLTVELLEAHKKGTLTSPGAPVTPSSPKGEEVLQLQPVCRSISTDSVSSDGALPKETGRANSCGGPGGLVRIVSPEQEEEDITQCAMPSASAGAARLLNAVQTTAPAAPASRKALVSDETAASLVASKYPLNSRAYIDRVLLADRRQQALALLFLLQETHRFAWEWHLKLLQFYHYYYHPILSALSDEAAQAVVERALLVCGSGSVRLVHPRFYRDGFPVDYQQYQYEFNEEWRKLFLSVRTYLAIPYRGADRSVSAAASEVLSDSSSLSPKAAGAGEGTVGFAATLLHSMELFQRQKDMQNAAQEAHDWTVWFYYTYLPAVESGREPDPIPSSAEATHEAGTTSSDDIVGCSAQAPDVLPMEWSEAQDSTLRSTIYWARRDAKLRTIRRATRRLHQQQQNHRKGLFGETGSGSAHGSGESRSSSRTSASTGTTSSASSVSSSDQRQVDEAVPTVSVECVLVDTARADEHLQLPILPTQGSALTMETVLASQNTRVAASPGRTATSRSLNNVEEAFDDYRVVNVGCFGFSFWSRADW